MSHPSRKKHSLESDLRNETATQHFHNGVLIKVSFLITPSQEKP